MIKKIAETLKNDFSDFTFKVDNDEEKQKATIKAEQGWTKGFEVDIEMEGNTMAISHSSKLTTMSYIISLGVVLLLTYLFGWQILGLLGLVSDGGSTMKILFAIPIAIFLIPTFIISSLVMKKVSPKDDALLENVKEKLSQLGHDAIID